MAKYHIKKDGTPGICNASINCPLGSENEHFNSFEDAQKYVDKLNEEQTFKLSLRSKEDVILIEEYNKLISPETVKQPSPLESDSIPNIKLTIPNIPIIPRHNLDRIVTALAASEAINKINSCYDSIITNITDESIPTTSRSTKIFESMNNLSYLIFTDEAHSEFKNLTNLLNEKTPSADELNTSRDKIVMISTPALNKQIDNSVFGYFRKMIDK